MSKKLHTEMRSALTRIFWLQVCWQDYNYNGSFWGWQHCTVSQLCVGFMPPCVPSESGPCTLQSPDSPLRWPASPSGPQPPSENTQRGLKYFHHQTWAVGNQTAADGVQSQSRRSSRERFRRKAVLEWTVLYPTICLCLSTIWNDRSENI